MVMGQSIASTEVLVIGAGPGGYVAAIRAAQLGFDVMLADKAGELGGMCLHHGCIPSKAFIHAMNLLDESRNAQDLGIGGDLTLDFAKTQQWKQGIVQELAGGIKGLLDKHGVEVVKATVRFQNENQAQLQPADGEQLDNNVVEFRHCIIATGSRPRPLPDTPFGGNILSSREVLQLSEVPKTFCVIGGGYIGVELGVMLRKAGAEVTIIEAQDSIIGVVEPELADVATKRLQDLGVTLKTQTKLEGLEDTGSSVKVTAGGETQEFEKVLVAIGHVPVTDELQLDLAGVQTDDRGFIQVDDQMRTAAQHIYAVGDAVGGVMLAHKAAAQGKVAAEIIAGKNVAFEPQVIPAVIFSDPEIATVGMREQEARERYGDVRVGKFPFSALGKALAIRQKEGFVKIIADANGVLLGVHAVGPSVTDYISEAALAIEMGASAEDLALTIHPHPTLGEVMGEASEAVMGTAIHIFQPKQ